MAVRKRNEFLDGDDSEDEIDRGYDSDEVEEGRGAIGGKTSKRRKVDSDDGSASDASDNEEGEETFHSLQDDASDSAEVPTDLAAAEAEAESETDLKPTTTKTLPSTTANTTPKQFAAAAKAARKSGVLYISRVPPFMKPQTMRHLLEPHAPKGLGRIFLTPEDPTSHKKRVRAGGNKKKSFTDGWIEFTSKTEAKDAAEFLNGNIIGGKKGSFYHDDMWNVKYLHGFKWSDLTDQIATENAERAARLREEVRKTRKENKAFAADVERGKMLDGMERKNEAKGKEKKEVGGGRERKAMEFKQKKAKSQVVEEGGKKEKPSADLSRVLGKIF